MTNKTKFGKINDNVGFSSTSGNSTGLTDKQKEEQRKNIASWIGGNKPNYR